MFKRRREVQRERTEAEAEKRTAHLKIAEGPTLRVEALPKLWASVKPGEPCPCCGRKKGGKRKAG